VRVAVCEAPGRLDLRRRPRPSPEAGQVLVRVSVCGLCASDLAMWRGGGTAAYPYSPGHEFCGTVEAGDDGGAAPLRAGERVVVNPNLGCGRCRYCLAGRPNLCDRLKTRPIKSNGGLADYVALDGRMVRRIPDALPDEAATFVEPLSCALHAANRLAARPGERVGVFGAGTMGVLTALALRRRSCAVLFIEPDAGRRKTVAGQFDAPAFAPEEVSGSDPPDAMDAAAVCCESARAVEQAVGAVRKGGRIVLLGVATGGPCDAAALREITTKELRLEGAWLNPHTFDEALHLAVRRRDVLAALATQTFSLDRVREAFEAAATRRFHRVLVRP